jgi:hypothetical protein
VNPAATEACATASTTTATRTSDEGLRQITVLPRRRRRRLRERRSTSDVESLQRARREPSTTTFDCDDERRRDQRRSRPRCATAASTTTATTGVDDGDPTLDVTTATTQTWFVDVDGDSYGDLDFPAVFRAASSPASPPPKGRCSC